ncbi:sensor histidine kinase [Catenulispora rubra]|uniref:sensor histidine kinase n=1 Tax=Catenulispora rubra TaxID=280293 RepID=UPI0018923B63|nr:histidine kinase [Catenulispora rubra]
MTVPAGARPASALSADVLAERARIAQEIHDVLAHSLAALSIQIQTARVILTDLRDYDRTADTLMKAQRMADEGLAETRRAVHALQVGIRPLDEELTALTGTHDRRYGVPVDFELGGTPRPLPSDSTIALLRVAQEALANAAKHTPGQDIAVELRYGAETVRLTIANDLSEGAATASTQAAATANGGYGLTRIHERLRLLDGALTAGPSGHRWIVRAELPLPIAAV